MGVTATFQRMIQFSLLLSCDSDLQADWVFQLSGSRSNSLNSRKLPGGFSLPKMRLGGTGPYQLLDCSEVVKVTGSSRGGRGQTISSTPFFSHRK